MSSQALTVLNRNSISLSSSVGIQLGKVLPFGQQLVWDDGEIWTRIARPSMGLWNSSNAIQNGRAASNAEGKAMEGMGRDIEESEPLAAPDHRQWARGLAGVPMPPTVQLATAPVFRLADAQSPELTPLEAKSLEDTFRGESLRLRVKV